MYVNPVIVGVFGTLIFEAILMTIFVIVSVKRGRNNEDSDDTSNE